MQPPLTAKQPPLAIIGMSCLFPKADGLEAYWANIKNGIDAITPIPESHWRPGDYFDADPKRPDHTYGRAGGFLEPFAFDPLKYGIPPNALEATDTSQLLAMAVADAAMEDAGYPMSREFDRNRVSVILGVTGALELVIPLGARLGHPAWRKAMLEAGVDPATADDAVQRIADSYVDWQENSFPGLLGNVVAGRVSKYLNTGGTNCVVDAACASSLSAVHLAALELATGKADIAVTGGVDTFNDIFMYMCFSKTPALSPTGHARPFDHEGDGTTLGEGIGLVVLKRLEDAQRDGDRVYAVIRGIGSSSDGKGDAIYAPNAAGQKKALIEAYANAGVTPDTIELVEAHGTGTKRGDAVEVSALNDVYRATGRDGAWCALGSIKSQIGHTKSAAGAAGLIKAALALHKKVLPPTAKVTKPQDAVAPGSTPFYVNTQKRPWIADGPRRAAVSSFGFGGSNFHCVLEEHETERTQSDWDGNVQLLACSAPDRKSLLAKLDAVPLDGNWRTIRDYAASTRAEFDGNDRERLLIVVERDKTDLKSTLNAIRTDDKLPKHAFTGSGPANGKIAFIFPGQGTQYVGMLRDLACTFPEFNTVLREANAIFKRSGQSSPLSDFIYPHPAFDDATRATQTAALTATDVAQPAIGALSLAACDLLQRFGVKPDAAAGHSYGELTALRAANALSTADFLKLSVERGRLMAQGDGDRGTMFAVRSSAEDVARLIESEQLDVVIANKNAPKQVVVSGATDAIDRAAEIFKQHKLSGTRLPVAAAFHSALVAPAAKLFREAVDNAKFQRTKIPVYANTTGAKYPNTNAKAASLLANQLAKPVEFVKLIEAMYVDGARTFVEVGPGGRMTNLVREILQGRDGVIACAIDASNGKANGIADLALALAQLAAAGHPVDLTKWDEGHTPRPAENRKPRLTVNLSGANYRAPRKSRPTAPTISASELTRHSEPTRHSERSEESHTPKTSAPSARITPAAHVIPARAGISDSTPASARNGGDSRFRGNDGASASTNEEKMTNMNEQSQPTTNGNLADLLRGTQQQIAALQRMQEQTAALHKQFLEGQEAATRAFAKLITRQRQLGLVSNSPAPQHTAPPPPTPPTHDATPGGTRSSASGVDAKTSDLTPNPGRAGARPSQAADAIADTLFEVVSEKTGYPTEMLEPEMTLDGDLGIDSIKRVEILSAMQERFPELPTLPADRLGAIHSLQDILNELGTPGGTRSSASGPGNKTPVLASNDGRAGAHPSQEIASVLLEIVSEKTGYPTEMLEPEMTLDGDLGIDSIKRVEILSAMQERFPELPTLPADRLGAIQTLQDILNELGADAATPGGTRSSASEPGNKTPDLAQDEERAEAHPSHAVEQLLLQVVSEKTGYPEGMLEIDMSLDADLGIDSIKRVEILSAMQEAMPELPQVEAEALGKIQTLRDVLDQLGDIELDAAAAASQHVSTDAQPASVEPLMRWLPTHVELPTAHAALNTPLRGEHPIWVTHDGSEFSAALVDALRRLELKAELVRIENLDAPQQLEGLIVVAPEQDAGESFLIEAFNAAKVAHPALTKTEGAYFATVSRMDGAFGLRDDFYPPTAVGGGLAGLAKTAQHEWPGIHARAIDVASDFTDAHAAAAAVVQALFTEGPVEIGVSREGMAMIDLVEAPLKNNEKHSAFSTDDVIVISGGARGVTAACARAIATTGATCILLGRTAWPVDEPEWLRDVTGEANIKRVLHANTPGATPKELDRAYHDVAAAREVGETIELLNSGANVAYRSVDVCDSEALTMVLSEIRGEFGDITGIVHGAGVLADRTIDALEREDVECVLKPKITGLQNLLAASGDTMKTLAVFSSSTARFGRKGQAAYAMANEAVNKIAQAYARQHPKCRVRALNWGPWDGGMVTPALKKLFASEGVGIIGFESGAQHLLHELVQGDSVEVVLMGPGTLLTPAQHAERTASDLPLAFECAIDTVSHSFLESHVIDAKAVAPVAMYVEWLAHGALHDNPGLRFQGIEGLRVFKGILLERGASQTLRIRAGKVQRDDNQRFRVRVELRSGTLDNEIRHAQADVILSTQLIRAKSIFDDVKLSIPARYRKPVYETGALFHGEALHGIAEVEGCSPEAIRCIARTAPRPKEWIAVPLRRSWIADPLVLDAAFQAMILWTVEEQGACSLPVRIGRYTQFEPFFPKGRIRIDARIRDAAPNRVTADIEFTVPVTGALVARIEDYECIVDASLQDAFKRNTLGAAKTHA